MTRIVMIVFLIIYSLNVSAITSATLAKATLKAALKTNGSCLRYQLSKRFCIWLSPRVGRNVTPWLDHYLPDVVVVVYRNRDDNPWTEARILVDKVPAAAQEMLIPNVGSGNHSFLDAHEQDVIFKEADVIGNPGLLVLPQRIPFLLLPSTAIPMNPYFQSMADSLLWRGFMPAAGIEEAASVVLGATHHLGSGLTDWGGVYPHEGVVMGNNDAKASMVIAQRAADLLTNKPFYGHIHQSLSNACGDHCKAASIIENSEKTLFQMVYPIEQDSCAVLGSDESYSDSMLNQDSEQDGAYVWIVWRHYEGCAPGDGIVIGVTP